ncbi:MAG TPA: dual specificity protein phosphatase [Gemmataceae bacterium]|nr:dual specificity protein phosphatase [Gemmataceae bacterium]
MDLIPLDERGRLFLSPDIDDWQALEAAGISAIFDVDGGIDVGVPTVPNQIIYLYFPFNDAEVPDCSRLHAVAHFGAALVNAGQRVLVHCGLGYNRSALVAGLILMHLGMTAAEAIDLLRQRRPGALFNQAFASYLLSCPLPNAP